MNINKHFRNRYSRLRRQVTLLLSLLLLFTILPACSVSEKPLSVVELLDLGEKYLLEMDYEQALVQFLKVIEVEPMNPRGYTGASEAYVGLGQQKMAIDILEQGRKTVGENESIQGMFDKFNKSEEERRQVEMDNGIKQELGDLLALYKTDGFESILEMIKTGAFEQMMANVKEFPHILINEEENYGIGIYDGGFLYIGGYVGGQRSGSGVWIDVNTTDFGYYVFDGVWANDAPNGNGIEKKQFLLDGQETEFIHIGSLANGLWEGKVSWYESQDLDTSDKWWLFSKGKLVILGETVESPDGSMQYPAGFRGNDESNLMYTTDDAIGKVYGILGFI